MGLYSEALAIDPRDADALAGAAVLTALCKNQGADAETLLEHAVDANPSHVAALCNYGQLLLNKAQALEEEEEEEGKEEEGEQGQEAKEEERRGEGCAWGCAREKIGPRFC